MRDNIELAVRTVVTFHHKYAKGDPNPKTPMEGTILVFVPGKPEFTEIVELLKNNMRRGFTANLYPYGFHSDTPAQDRDFSLQEEETQMSKEEMSLGPSYRGGLSKV